MRTFEEYYIEELRKPLVKGTKNIKTVGKAAKGYDKLTGRVQHKEPPPGSTPATGLAENEKVQ